MTNILIPKRILRVVKLIPVEHMDEVLKNALALKNPDRFLGENDITGESLVAPTVAPSNETQVVVRH